MLGVGGFVSWPLALRLPTHSCPPSHTTPPLRSASQQDGEYGAAQLRAIFTAHGPVEDVVLREGKKRKGSALVVMADAAGAAAAAAAVNGPLSNPLLVVPFLKAAGAADEDGPAAGGSGRGGPALDPAATRLPPAAPAPAFAAAAAAGGLGPRPGAPLFAAGARAGSGAAVQQQPAAPLFPGGGGASSFSGRPAFAAGGAGTAPARPAFAAAAAAGGGGGPVAASSAAFAGGFASFGGLPSSSGVHALNGGLEDATLAKMRQADERRRLIAELEGEGEGAG